MTTTEPIESHDIHSRRMLDHAAEMLAQGDRLQTSEKVWGAVAHRVKQIATERDWPNDSHTDGFSIAHYVARATGDQRISDLYAIASDTHQNYYEDRLSIPMLAERLSSAHELCNLLLDAHRRLPPDLPMPDDRHYCNRHS